MTTHNSSKKLTLIGLGPMGQAMAKVYLEKGYEITIWNRTPGKADKLVEMGATFVANVEDALAANKLVLLSLTDYEVMYNILNAATKALPDRVLVNLSSDTPEKAREAAKWAANNGAKFLTAGIMADPPMVGQPEAYVFYSGEEAIFREYEPILEQLGKGKYLGNDPGLALLYYQAQLDILFTSAAGILHAMALIKSANIPAADFEPFLKESLATLPYFFQTTSEEVDNGQYNGEQNNMIMMAAGMDHIAHASKDAGIDAKLPNVIKEIFDKTVAKGYGKEGLNSIIEVLKKHTE